ncbi:histidine phosphatase family protein [Proteiniclasticum ruminis]|uniref:Phosphoglycerate mutase n=1 Tax=Proteiniclasticum ruminis TaxID=398199 RepID=A0A1I5ERT8_9CLOT|nr:histidine phosphatase family protein [Proteiniclasticum ruminis]SFO14224.1 phosphoglycerate mutase [Proteiniclasticum ruminis]
MLNLYITRHGETQWNTQKRLQGWMNSPLTERGIAQGKMLHEAVKMYNIEKIYTSPSERAAKTALAAKGHLPLEVEFLEELKEMNMGDWEGKTLEEIRAKEPDNFENYWNKPHLFQKNSGENFDEILGRAQKALDIITKNHPSGNILIVTHGVTLKALMSQFSPEGFIEFWKKPVVEQASISKIVISPEGSSEIALYGDTKHFSV